MERLSKLDTLIEQFAERLEQLTMCELYELFGVVLVHALPDDTEEQMKNDRIDGYTTYKTLDAALNTCLSKPIENLCTSSVKKGDDYNRWFGRYYGLLVLDGQIVSTSRSDGKTWHKRIGYYTKLASNRDILNSVFQDKSRNEINIRTKPDKLLPFFDLDHALQNLKYGAITPDYMTKRSVYDEFLRFKKIMDDRNFPYFALYKGQIVRFEPEVVAEAIKDFQTVQNDLNSHKQRLALLEIKLGNLMLQPVTFNKMLQAVDNRVEK